MGASYTGKMNVTNSGRTCQVWEASQPHEHSFTHVGEHNYCRQPTGTIGTGVWCYTTDPNLRWEYCPLPTCDPTYKCQEGNPLGVSYAGIMNTTASGRTCKDWAATMYEMGEHNNYCRNPAGFELGVWCYTTDPDKEWEYCSVPICDPTYKCQRGDPLGVSYAGIIKTTASGRTCKDWAATSFPHLGEHNYCRNPAGIFPGGVWCFTTDPNKLWEFCSVPKCAQMLKVLDFSANNDHEPDSNGELTGATLSAGFLPESFTICLSIMVDAWSWTTEIPNANIFTLLDVRGYTWGTIKLATNSSHTTYEAWLGSVFLLKPIEAVFFPLQWTRACLSLDSNASKVTLVVDGQLLGEEEYRREDDKYRPENFHLVLGYDPSGGFEYENIFLSICFEKSKINSQG